MGLWIMNKAGIGTLERWPNTVMRQRGKRFHGNPPTCFRRRTTSECKQTRRYCPESFRQMERGKESFARAFWDVRRNYRHMAARSWGHFSTHVSRKEQSLDLKCGHRVVALHDGEEIFPAMLQSIDEAKTQILLEMYWFASDDAGYMVADRLRSARERGVQVSIIYDAFGSIETQPGMFTMLREAGCEVAEFNPLWPWPKLATNIVRRDHRKMLVIDRKTAFTGGLNIANHWLPSSFGGNGWRDVMVKIEGPVAEACAQIIERMLALLQEAENDHSALMYIRSLQRAAKLKMLQGRVVLEESKLKISERLVKSLSAVKLKKQHNNFLEMIPYHLRHQMGQYGEEAIRSLGERDIEKQEESFTEFDKQFYSMPSPTSIAWWSSQDRLRALLLKKNKLGDVGQSEENLHNTVPTAVDGLIGRYEYSNIQLMTNDIWSQRSGIRRGYLRAIEAARKRITIVNSYFLPDFLIRQALYRAVERGVHVQVVVAGKSDVPPVWYAQRAKYEMMLRKGVEIYEWQPSVLHTKLAIFDSEVSTLGTYNFDYISWRNNLEIVAIIHDSEFAKSLDQRIQHDIDLHCHKMELASWTARSLIDRVFERFFHRFRHHM